MWQEKVITKECIFYSIPEERIEAGSQMSQQERNQIMLDFARINTSIDESMEQINQSLLDQHASQTENETSDLLLTGSFAGVGDGIHDAQGIAKVIPRGRR